MGDIAPDETVTVTFDAGIDATAYGWTIYNAVVAASDNADPEEDDDGGITVAPGEIRPFATKTASVSQA